MYTTHVNRDASLNASLYGLSVNTQTFFSFFLSRLVFALPALSGAQTIGYDRTYDPSTKKTGIDLGWQMTPPNLNTSVLDFQQVAYLVGLGFLSVPCWTGKGPRKAGCVCVYNVCTECSSTKVERSVVSGSRFLVWSLVFQWLAYTCTRTCPSDGDRHVWRPVKHLPRRERASAGLG